jgi:gliding motility-associated lipoprotein GldD
MKKSLIIAFLFVATACNSPFMPKPRGYFSIPFPVHAYQTFSKDGFPYQFEYPVYANITREGMLSDDNPDNPFWFNIDFPQFNGRIYISYKTIGGFSTYKIKTATGYRDSLVKNTFEGLRDEAFRMTFKHTLRASSIEDSLFQTANGISGVYFKVGGNAATANQFFITDTFHHFLRGALYFDAVPNTDSIKPVVEFLQKDLHHIIEHFKWK